MNNISVIDEYLADVNASQKKELERIRRIVKQIIPDAEETISYGMPVIKYKGKYVIGFTAFKNHMSVFPGSEPVESMKKELSKFKTSKGTIQFTADHVIPEPLLRDIILTSLEAVKHSK